MQSTIQSQIQRQLLIDHGVSTSDRRAALQVARSLQSQLFFYEVEWGGRTLQDGVEDVYMFLDDQDGGSDAMREELPTGVITMLTKCYSPSCWEGAPCYAYSCPRRVSVLCREVCAGVDRNYSKGTLSSLFKACRQSPRRLRRLNGRRRWILPS